MFTVQELQIIKTNMATYRAQKIAALQKQVGCSNHRVVTLVADKLERRWLLEVCFDVED